MFKIISMTENMILDIDYSDYTNLKMLATHNFYVGCHTFDKASLHIVKYSFNHITLVIL
jgi:hypothetical protein